MLLISDAVTPREFIQLSLLGLCIGVILVVRVIIIMVTHIVVMTFLMRVFSSGEATQHVQEWITQALLVGVHELGLGNFVITIGINRHKEILNLRFIVCGCIISILLCNEAEEVFQLGLLNRTVSILINLFRDEVEYR